MKIILAAACLGSLLLASCVPSTPRARIQQNPQKFSRLSSSQQALVQNGQITRGMPRDAVYLAWGSPYEVFHGSRKEKTTERWDYVSTHTVTLTNFYGSYGYGYGAYGSCGPMNYTGLGIGLGPEIAHLPYRSGSVWFVNERVDAWERAR